MRKYLILVMTSFLLISSPNSWAEINDLPLELRVMVFEYASIKDILNFCMTSKANQQFCHANEKPFWKALVERDFGEAHLSKDTSITADWKQTYLDTDEVFYGSYVKIPGGEYEIGSPGSEIGRNNNENLHKITLSDFEIMSSAVTQAQYAKTMGTNPSRFKTDKDCPDSFRKIRVNKQEIPVCANHPVERVTWFQAKEFADKLSAASKIYNYSLPSEARLEVALRGGTKTAYTFGDDASKLSDYVRYRVNSNKRTHPVKSLLPNAYGIYRGGGVWEWAGDWYDKDYSGSEGRDPTGPTSGSLRVIRGGSWYSIARYCRSAYRSYGKPASHYDNLGFRLVRTKKSIRGGGKVDQLE